MTAPVKALFFTWSTLSDRTKWSKWSLHHSYLHAARSIYTLAGVGIVCVSPSLVDIELDNGKIGCAYYICGQLMIAVHYDIPTYIPKSP